MDPYLIDTEYAMRGLFDLAQVGDSAMRRLKSELASAEAGFAADYIAYSSLENNDDYSEGQLNHVYGKAMQFHEDARHAKVALSALRADLDNKEVALQALCAAILQIAKQGLSQRYGALPRVPPTRLVPPSSLSMSTLV